MSVHRPLKGDMTQLQFGGKSLHVGDMLRLTLADGQSVEGHVKVVGADFVGLMTNGGGERVVPFAAIELLTVLP